MKYNSVFVTRWKKPKPQKGSEDEPEKLQTKSTVVGSTGKYYRQVLQTSDLGDHLGKPVRQTIVQDKP